MILLEDVLCIIGGKDSGDTNGRCFMYWGCKAGVDSGPICLTVSLESIVGVSSFS